MLQVLVIDDTGEGQLFQRATRVVRTLVPEAADRYRVEADWREISPRLRGYDIVIFVADEGEPNPVIEPLMDEFDGPLYIVAPELTPKLVEFAEDPLVEVYTFRTPRSTYDLSLLEERLRDALNPKDA